MFSDFRDSVVISQTSSFIVTPATHLSFLGYHEIFPNIVASNDVYLYSSIRTVSKHGYWFETTLSKYHVITQTETQSMNCGRLAT